MSSRLHQARKRHWLYLSGIERTVLESSGKYALCFTCPSITSQRSALRSKRRVVILGKPLPRYIVLRNPIDNRHRHGPKFIFEEV